MYWDGLLASIQELLRDIPAGQTDDTTLRNKNQKSRGDDQTMGGEWIEIGAWKCVSSAMG
jgi:hypothetical protein